MFMPGVQGGHTVSNEPLTLNITSNAVNVNILTLAVAAGYDASTDNTAIIVNVAGGVAITANNSIALRTGALNAGSSLTVNIASGASITGFTGPVGANGSSAGAAGSAGSAGGDAILFEISSPQGTYLVDNDGVVSAGGGGGGGFGRGGTAGAKGQQSCGGKGCSCNNSVNVYGSAGSNGSAGSSGSVGQAGSAGSAGSAGGYPANNECSVTVGIGNGGAGGAGGAAGRAMVKQGVTVSTTGSAGTFNGAIV